MLTTTERQEIDRLKGRIRELEREVRALQAALSSSRQVMDGRLIRFPLRVPILRVGSLVVEHTGLIVEDASGDPWMWVPDDTTGAVTVSGVGTAPF